MPRFESKLTPARLDPDDRPVWGDRFGAEVEFYGVVRGVEAGEIIEGIEYSAYPEMAERELARLGAEAEGRFPPHRAKITHRIGFVPAGEPSVALYVGSPHSAEAFDVSRWLLAELKCRVPIWKRIVFPVR